MVKCCVFFAARTELFNNSSVRSATPGSHRGNLEYLDDMNDRGDLDNLGSRGETLTTWQPDDYGACGVRAALATWAIVATW
jgi:hypothetical protein